MICTINEANPYYFAHSFPSYPTGGMKTLMPFGSEAANLVVQRWKILDHFFWSSIQNKRLYDGGSCEILSSHKRKFKS